MANSASRIGSLHHVQSDSHACSSVTASVPVVTETPCSLFQQPPPPLPRLFLPPVYSDTHPHSLDAGFSRNHSQSSRLTFHKRPEQVGPEYDIFGGLDLSRSSDISSRALYFPHSRADSELYSGCKQEESDLFVPLNRHSRIAPSILDYPSTFMSEGQLQSSLQQDYPVSSESITQSPTGASSRPSSSCISKSTNSATGSFSRYSVLDTSAGTTDFAQYDTSYPSSSTSASDASIGRSAGEPRGNDAIGSGGPARPKKQRPGKARERARIALAPDQPPTTQGKQRERVYVACQQCRNRKIRCDGAKPMCYNCNQRGTGICEFDTVPKRRGPDRQPGARQRHGKVPVPRRRRSMRNDKEGVLSTPQGASPYLATLSGSESTISPSNDQNSTTWARIPSPPSSASTNDYTYGHDQPVPGSPDSDTSQTPQDYRHMLAPSFAYNAPQDGYVSNTLKPEDPRLLLSRISTEAVSQPFTSSLSPGTQQAQTPYSTLTSPFGAQPTASYSSVSSALVSETIGAGLDNVPRLDGCTSPVAVRLGDFVPRELHVAQPVAVEQEPVVQVTYAFGIPATQQRGSGYSAVPDAAALHSRRESLGSVSTESYNPYRWAVHHHGQSQNSYGAYISSSSEDEENAVPYEFTISQAPSLDFFRKTWWDSLVDIYCVETYCTPAIVARYELAYGVSVSVPCGALVVGTARQRVAQIIVHDLQTIFRDSIFWFSFFNVPLFFGTLFRAREAIQPALVYALLMWSNYLRSSSADLGPGGMRRTLWLREKAQAALDASVNASWIDPSLAQAAWLLSLFELSSHPDRSVARLHSALGTLDSIIHALALTSIDVPDPSISGGTSDSLYRGAPHMNGAISHVLPMPLYNRKPIAGVRPKFRYSSQLLQYHSPNEGAADLQRGGTMGMTGQVTMMTQATCICNELTLGKVWSEAKDHVPFWLSSPAWNPSWTDAEVRREECRRLCWNTLHLFAGYTTYRTSLGLQTLDLFLLHPSNVHNIFPGENLTDLLSSTPSTPKLDTVWALYARAILLWHACLRIRNVSERERALFSQSVWLEADAIENALDGHSCNTERAFLYHGREYLFNARMYVSSEFRRFVPHPSPDMSGAVHRRKAEEWLTHQATLAKRIMHGLQNLTGLRGSLLAKRPFFCYWFMGHMSRCLQLWQADKSLIVALELAKNFLSPINYLSALWPCEDQRTSYAYLRKQLENACYEAGLSPPPPVDPAFPFPTNFMGLF